MRLFRAFALIVVAFCASFAWSQAPSAKKTPYTDLGHFKGGAWAEACETNNAGIVVGFGNIRQGYTRPLFVFATGPNAGKWFDLGTLGGERTDWKVMAMGVSDTGIISGHSALKDGTIHAFVWTPDAGMLDIGTLNGDAYSASSNMNRMGTVVTGWSGPRFLDFSDPNVTTSTPVVWTPSPKWQGGKLVTVWNIQRLDTTGFDSNKLWLPNAANDYAQVVGLSVSPAGMDAPMLWTPLPGERGWSVSQLPIPPGFDQAGANDINDKGEVAGWVAPADWSMWFPVVWKPLDTSRTTYTYVLLTSLSGSVQDGNGGWAEANGINDLGDVVGDSWDASGNNDVAVVWNLRTPDTVQSLGLPDAWNVAAKINDLRMIVAYYAPDWTNEYVNENVVTIQLH